MKMSEFIYNLPEEKIAKFPPEVRGSTNLLVLDRSSENLDHKKYFNIPEYIEEGDVVVLNETKVEKRRTFFLTEKLRRLEVLFLNRIGDGRWYCLIKGARYVKDGDILVSEEDGDIKIRISEKSNAGFLIEPISEEGEKIFDKVGHTPIPPYMKRSDTPEDYIRYNTVFARILGSVAAPTASLNLTDEILAQIQQKGAKVVKVELKVGWGTFAPIREENIEEHNIHKEEITISKESAEIINDAKKQGKKIWAFGTTVARTLETVADENGNVHGYKGETQLYIYPGYTWKCVDHLVTNFHMPDSSLILLVSSFAGKELIKKAYQEALDRDYKFLSYGDSMLII
jgi:S-adenosylmethionine:tRNA ribosyltransferase-isomerase